MTEKDYIDREEFISDLRDLKDSIACELEYSRYDGLEKEVKQDLIDFIIDELTCKDAADVSEVIHGRWVELTATPCYDNKNEFIYKVLECVCSECGCHMWFYETQSKYRYCPRCGSIMDLEVSND